MACAGESNQEVGRAIEAAVTSYSQNNQANTADPVNVVTGGFLHSEQDVAFPSQRLTIALSRHYNSQLHKSNGDRPDGFGPGWTHSLGLRVEASGSEAVTYIDDHGAEIIFEFESTTGPFVAPAGSLGMRLTRRTNEGYELRQIDGVVAEFGGSGRVESLLRPGPRSDSRIDFKYDQIGRLISVQGAASRGLSFTYDGDDQLIRAMRDHTGREWRYLYNSHYELVEVHSPGDRIRRYEYGEWHGRVAVKRKVCDMQSLRALHRVFAFSVDDNPDPSVPIVTNSYTTDGRVHRQVDALGYDTRFEYNLLTRMASVTDAMGYSTLYCFDQAGNTTKVRRPSGSTTEYIFDNRRNLLAEIDPGGQRTEYVNFQDSSKLDSQTQYGRRATGTRWEYLTFSESDIARGYDLEGNRPLRRDVAGRVTLFEEYTCFGKPRLILLPDGSEVLTDYEDRSGLPLRQTKPLQIGRDEPLTLVEEWEYDDWGNCIRHKTLAQRKNGELESGCRVESFEFDSEGQHPIGMRSWIETAGEGESFASESRYRWDALGRLIEETSLRRTTPDAQPIENRRRFVYDEFGRMVAELLPDNSANCFLYDPNDHLLETFRVADVTGSALPAVPDERRIHRNRWKYDAMGREVAHIDPSGAVTRRQWDGRGLCTEVVDTFERRTEFVYDRDGRLIEEHRSFGEQVSLEYDSAGRLVNRHNNLGSEVHFASDALGRTVETHQRSGNQTFKTSYAYDLRDHIALTKYPDDSFEALTYDEFGNIVRRELGRLPAELESIEIYKYDGLGRLLTVELGGLDSRVEQFRFQYIDGLRQVKTFDALGNITSSNFDTEGCLIQREDADGRILRFEYDSLLRILKRHSTDRLVDDTFTYATGEFLVSASVASIDYRWEYDKAGRTVRHWQTVLDDTRTIEYQYDRFGRLIGKVMDDRWWMRYFYGPSWLPSAIEIPTNKVELEYDQGGRIAREVWLDGGCKSYEYFADNSLHTLQSTDCRGNKVFTQAFERDSRGRPSREYHGGISEHSNIFRYDSLNRLVRVDRIKPDGEIPFRQFVYDNRGNRVEEYQNDVLFSTNKYDAANRLVQIRGTDESQVYEYDRSGNLIYDGHKTYSYDAAHRLRSISDHLERKQLASYQYAATGERAISEYGDIKERSFHDNQQEILCEVPSGYSTAFWGLELDVLLATGNDGCQATRAYTDSSGSLIATDSSETQREYDPFGKIIVGEALALRYGFGCKQLDRVAGHYYNRARFYDPKIGRFTQPDLKGLVDGVNLYVFARNNPLQYVDKSGYTARHESHGRITDLVPALAFFPGQNEGRSYVVAPGSLEKHSHVTHYDKSWNMLGRSYVVAPGWLETRPHVEHFDAKWNLVGRSYVAGPGFLETQSHIQHYDKDWDRAGKTYVQGPGWLESQPHFQHYENNWDKAGRTYVEGPGLLESKAHFHHYNF